MTFMVIIYGTLCYGIGIFVEKFSVIKENSDAWHDGFKAGACWPLGNIIAENTIDGHKEIMVEHFDGTCARYRKVEVE